ncbi:MAG: DUF4783 domain-containing protein [Ignavibacteriaceae bacterium]|nr:DUF4783 domain-containing protein [Ignavibacteriaceae bacterium]
MKNFYPISFILIVILSTCLIQAQNKELSKSDSNKQKNSAYLILTEIEEGIARGNIAIISRHLSPQTYFSLTNGIRGYFSSNQAYYILEDFYKVYQVLSFKFHSIQTENGNPYATGIYFYEFKGKRETAQVYVSLKNIGKSWKIIQITFN